jgi:hypothetical protein
MIYWILSDIGGVHALRQDGDFEPLRKRDPCSDDVERFYRHADAVAKAAKLRKRGCHCKPLKQEGIVLYWRLPAGLDDENDLAQVVEFRSRRQADAWSKQALAEGCEVIECLGLAKPRAAKRVAAKRRKA